MGTEEAAGGVKGVAAGAGEGGPNSVVGCKGPLSEEL